MKAFIYCPLVWMFISRIMNKKINCIQERALRLVYSDHVSFFDELLKKDRSFFIHYRNIQSLAIEFYKFSRSFHKYHEKTQIFHTTLGHTVNFIVEIQKQ